MGITFASNQSPTLGVELELTLVDRSTRQLTSAATEILTQITEGGPGEEHPKAKHELFECTIEIITGVCSTVSEARADLEETLTEIRPAADQRDLSLISVGTHPFSRWRDQVVSPSERYAELVQELQWTARRLAIYGAHFHVAVRSGERAVAIANALRTYLPHLLALSASSPYWEEEDSGLASSRIKIFESLPTAGLNPHIADWDEFQALMATLLRAQCIRSIREIWWDIRPHPNFGTVELRMCDAPPTLREVSALAALAQSLVEWLNERYEAGHRTDPRSEWTLRENKWLATRHGIDARLITDPEGLRRPARDLVAELVHDLGPTADRLGCREELEDVLRILDHGPSYLRQRGIREGGGTPQDVVDALVKELDTDEPLPP
jgi:carboxylate-amine ligase